MVQLNELWPTLLSALGSVALVFVMIIANQVAKAIKEKYLTEADKQKIENLEKSATAAVQAADQKIGNASTFVTQILGDKPTGNGTTDELIKWNEAYKEYSKSTNEQKKNMVLDFLEAKFPDVPFEEIEVHLENAYQDYKKQSEFDKQFRPVPKGK